MRPLRAAALRLQAWRDRWPGACPLCAGPATGGCLCAACEEALCGPARRRPEDGGDWRCPRCALPLPAHDTACPDCAGQPPAFLRTLIAFDYRPPADTLVLRLKAGRNPAGAGLLGMLLADAAMARDWLPPPGTVLLPVPASTASLRLRGFNPAAEIARALGRRLELPVGHGLLRRTRAQDAQHRLGLAARRAAVRGLYACAGEVAGRHVGLVDDVMTTGSTLREIAGILEAAGAAGVTAFVAARTPHPWPAPARLSQKR